MHNRTSRSITTTGTVTETYSCDSFSNRLSSVDDGSNTRSFTYTAAGNITTDDRGAGSDHGFFYNAANRLEEVERNSLTEASYLYNALGERALKNDAVAGISHYHYDLSGRLIAVSDDSGDVVEEYLYLEALPVAMITPSASATTVTEIVIDNGDSETASNGTWNASTAVSGYEDSELAEVDQRSP